MEKLKKIIRIAKDEGDKETVQKLQQAFDAELEEIRKNLDWKRYEEALRGLEDKPDMEDFPKDGKKSK
tara:strand:+ start:2050 stop:2253 length:204 start_codon:yes stop_codon:yes gene_type:complete